MDSPSTLQNQDFLFLQESIAHPAPEQLLVLDAQLRIQAASQSFYTVFQVTPAQTIGENVADVGTGQLNISALLTRLNALPKMDSEFEDVEVEHDFPALGCRTMLVSARRLSGVDEHSGLILLSIRLTTGPVKADAGEMLTRFHALASIGDAVIVTDLESRITFMNSAAEKLTGCAHNDALQKNLREVANTVSEQSYDRNDPIVRAISERTAVPLMNRTILIAQDGSEWPINGNAAPIFDSAGRLIGVVLVFHDVSYRRQAEQQLEISELRYRRVFESAHDGILILDAVSAKVLDVNPYLCDLLGYPAEHFLGKELWEIGVFKDAEMSKIAMEKLQRSGLIRYEDLPLQHKDGRHIPVEFVSNVYREGRRNVIQCNIRNITHRKRMAQDLAKAMVDAENANRSKSEFLANMSHEIRTPMGAILGFADMLLNKSPEECAQAGCVQIIRRNSLHLLELINEILDLSKIESGQMNVERVSCNLPELLSEVTSLMRLRAAEKGLAFGVTFHGPIPRLIQSDPLRLRQILVNLLGNAIKFTESGRIDVRTADEGADGPNIALRIEVIDSGIGMTPELVERLFLPFTQGDASITRKFGGTGLGLTISRQLARLMGGDVTSTSQPGIGSTFTLKTDGGPSAGIEKLQDLTESTLPGPVPPGAKSTIDLRGRILLVEDGADNQRLLRMQLTDAGASVTSALNGQVAVDLATTHTFDLILMDMQMPIMDGYAATTELRRKGLTIPIVALTAHAMAEDRAKCIAAGCTDYLSKPIAEEQLLMTANKYLGNNRLTVPADNAGAAPPHAPVPDGDSTRIQSTHSGNARIMQIVPEFVDALPAKVHQLLGFVEHNDLPQLQRLAHQLLGTCGGYGFAVVSQPASTVEQSAKAGKSLDGITPEVESLIGVIRRIHGYDESKETAPAP